MENRNRKRRGRRRPLWKLANQLISYNESNPYTDDNSDDAGATTQPIRSMNTNAYPSQMPPRQPPRLQNTQKTALGNGTGGWGGFGMPSSGGAFAGLGGAPGLGNAPRPGQLSGFAQVMGGGNGQGPIDMR